MMQVDYKERGRVTSDEERVLRGRCTEMMLEHSFALLLERPLL